ncbi:MAG: hypothetical protein LKH04_05630 [Lachnospiraceae bacterium]|jgi:phosphoribosylaminoimidazole carboxylase (NCAIR synthetase)|nr:hypothetical protein [Lachnospiraceae bacterium]MCI1423768.1 hypothetical protein [Lachnospiraceae bacterium]MCI1452552.1 hypothetical protein [Lachnospiraceae bacterium]
MDVITLEKEKVPEEKLEAFEKELTESGTPLPEEEVLAALLGKSPLRRGASLQMTGQRTGESFCCPIFRTRRRRCCGH